MTKRTFRRAYIPLLVLTIAVLGPSPTAGGAEPDLSGKLAFRRGSPAALTDIWVMNADRTALRRVSCNSLDDQGPAWSPNGKTIVFHTQEPGLQNLYLIDVGDECGTGTFLTEGRFASWAPGGQRLAFDRGSFGARDVFVLDCHPLPVSLAVAFDALPSCTETNLTNDAAERNFRPDWSPDGTKIVFAKGPEQAEDIWVMTYPEGPGDPVVETQLTFGGTGNAPQWSPDGEKILFQSNRDRPDGGECPPMGPCDFDEIYVMNADGTDQTRLTNFAGSDASPRWSPDGRHIVFHRDVNTSTPIVFQLFIMNADGTEVTQLTEGTVHNFPDWGRGRIAG